jgi:hypothetical protein
MISRATVILSATAVAGLVLGARLVLWPLAPVVVPEAVAADQPVATTAPPVPDSLVQRFVARDPFRLTRRPADVSYDPLRLAEQLVPPAPKPVLALSGIVWTSGSGAAVVIGFPGVDGPRVLRVGDQVAGIKVRKVARDSVWLAGMDTTWVLTIKEVR